LVSTDENEDLNIEESPYAEWLEGTIRTIVTLQPDAIGLVAVRDSDGMALTSYYNAGVREKTEFIHHILSDNIMEIIENNATTVRNIIMDADDDEVDDMDDEEESEDGDWLTM